MARKDKQVAWETNYVDKVAFLNELVKERMAFLATFTLPGYEEESQATDSSDANAGDAASTVSGNSNEEKTWNFFAQKGFTAAAVAGIMGNLKQESGIDPKKTQYGGGPGTGLCQWEKGGRWDSLLKWAKAEGKDEWDIVTQLDYLWLELNGRDSTTLHLLNKNWGGIEGLKSTKDYKYAVDAFEKSFERAGKPNLPRRYEYAKAFLDKYGKGNGSAAAGTVGASGAKGSAGVEKVISIAESWTKKPNKYVFGGGRSEADIRAGRFDCSSWCRYVFSEAGHDISSGNNLWVNTDTIMKNKNLKTIKTSDLKRGDLMYFDTYKTYGHITICLGDGKAIGTQGSTGVAVIDYQNNSYWKSKISNQHKRVL